MNEMTWRYVKPLLEKDSVEKFEASNNVSFPENLKQVLKAYNGGRPSLRYYDLPGNPDREFKCLLSFNRNDAETIYKCFPLDSSDTSIVPFATDSAGNKFVVKDGEIWLWEHEADSLKYLAGSFTEFILKLHS